MADIERTAETASSSFQVNDVAKDEFAADPDLRISLNILGPREVSN